MATIEFYRDTIEQRELLRERLPNEREPDEVAAFLPDPLLPDSARHRDIGRYLNYFEMLATGTNRRGRRLGDGGILDIETVDYLLGPRILAIWGSYGPYIRGRRLRFGEPTLYAEIEVLAAEVSERRKRQGYSHLPSALKTEDWTVEHRSRVWAAPQIVEPLA
jgi:hypothetical protein